MAEEETIVSLMESFQKEDRFNTDYDSIVIDKNKVPYHGNEYFSALLFLPSGSHKYAYSLPFNGVHDSVLIKRVKEPEELHVFRGMKDTCQDAVLLDFSMKSRMHPGVRLGMPVYDDDGKRLGVLCSILPIESINEIMYEENQHNGLGESGEAYLVGSDYYMRSTSRFHDSANMSTVVKTPGGEKALAGERGVDRFYDYRGVKVLSSYARLNSVKAGAKGYLPKNITADELHEAIVAVYEGREYFSKSISEHVFLEMMRKTRENVSTSEKMQNLTEREIEVLKKVAEGLSNGDIADQLCISIRTVETHKTNVLRKLNINNTVELVKYPIQHNLITLST
ncbi:MAG: LuxR C-terminal-related transcriptional regulator [Bacteroidales bacterium]